MSCIGPSCHWWSGGKCRKPYRLRLDPSSSSGSWKAVVKILYLFVVIAICARVSSWGCLGSAIDCPVVPVVTFKADALVGSAFTLWYVVKVTHGADWSVMVLIVLLVVMVLEFIAVMAWEYVIMISMGMEGCFGIGGSHVSQHLWYASLVYPPCCRTFLFFCRACIFKQGFCMWG